MIVPTGPVNIQALTEFLRSAGVNADYRWTPTLALAISPIAGTGPPENPVIVTEFESETLVSWLSGLRGRSEQRFADLREAVLFALEKALRLRSMSK